MKYKLELTPEQMLVVYSALDWYGEQVEGIISDEQLENGHHLDSELFVIKILKNRISSKLTP